MVPSLYLQPQETMTMISDLPSDLVEEIVSLVPLKSMRAVRLTCKKWNTLTKSGTFLKMRIGKAASKGESQMIVNKDSKLYLMSVVVNGDPYIEPKGKLTCLNEQVKISKIFYCEGLLLCILNEDYITWLVVWNPYCGQTRWIQPRNFYGPMMGWDRCNYAFGYVEKKNKSSCRRSHKILRFIENFFYTEDDYEIYDFDSDSWRTLDVTPHWCITFYDLGVSLEGNTYWCATKRHSEDDIYIICFDFTKERFGPLLLLPFSTWDHDNVILSCVREENLAALFQHQEPNRHELEIWITTKIETKNVSWSKFLKVDMGPEISFIFQSFIIDEEKKIAMCFDEWNHHRVNFIGEAGYLRHVDVGEPAGRNCSPHLCIYYVPSLVQTKPLAGGNRKR